MKCACHIQFKTFKKDREMKQIFQQRGFALYNPEQEHDACGVGLVANFSGEASHDIVRKGISVLARLMHRGAAGSDPETGDGAGLLLSIPDEFFRANVNSKLPEARIHRGCVRL